MELTIELKSVRIFLCSEYEPPLGVGGCPAGFKLLRTFGDFLKLLRKTSKLGILRAAGAKIESLRLFSTS